MTLMGFHHIKEDRKNIVIKHISLIYFLALLQCLVKRHIRRRMNNHMHVVEQKIDIPRGHSQGRTFLQIPRHHMDLIRKSRVRFAEHVKSLKQLNSVKLDIEGFLN